MHHYCDPSSRPYLLVYPLEDLGHGFVVGNVALVQMDIIVDLSAALFGYRSFQDDNCDLLGIQNIHDCFTDTSTSCETLRKVSWVSLWDQGGPELTSGHDYNLVVPAQPVKT